MTLKRTLVAALVAILVVLGLVTVFQNQLIERMFPRFVERLMVRDRIAELGEGLHVLMCGTGTPLPDPNRAGPCTIVLAGDEMVMIDAGSAGIRVAQLMGVQLAELDAILLTHLHSDHIDGLGESLLQAWVGGTRSEPIPVLGPTGTDEVVAGFNAAYAIDHGYRVAHHGEGVVPADGAGGTGREFETPTVGAERVVYSSGGLEVTAFKVEHDPVHDAVGYRFDYRGRSVVISGDTDYAPEIARVARGADLLIHEALQPKMVEVMRDAAERSGRPTIAKIMDDILDYHASPEEAARAANDAGVGMLVFHHTIPPIPSPRLNPLFLGGAPGLYDGTITVAVDGMAFTLPLDGGPIRTSDLL